MLTSVRNVMLYKKCVGILCLSPLFVLRKQDSIEIKNAADITDDQLITDKKSIGFYASLLRKQIHRLRHTSNAQSIKMNNDMAD